MKPALNGGDGSAVINKVILKRQKEREEEGVSASLSRSTAA